MPKIYDTDSPVRLDTRPGRTDLTSRECAKILGGLLGSLCQNAAIEDVRLAVTWWSQNETAWATFRQMNAYFAQHPEVDVASKIPLADEPPTKVQ